MNNHDDSTTEVLIAGMAVADFVFRVRAIPTEAEKYRADSMEIVVGGPAANAAIAISRLGGRAVLSTRLGEDGVADAIQGNLEAEGVDCRIRRAGRSPLSAVAVDAAGERQVVNFRGEALAEEPEPLDDLMPAAVLVDMGWTRAALAGLALARARGVPGVVDAEAPATEAVLEAASHVAFPRRGLTAFAGIGDKEEALLAASRKLDGWVCVTDGAAGVSYVAEDRMETVSAFPIVGGEMLRRSLAFTGTSGVVRFDRPAQAILKDIMDCGMEHHMAVAYGDHRGTLASLAAALDLPLVELGNA